MDSLLPMDCATLRQAVGYRGIFLRLLLDARGVDMPMASTSTFVMRSSWKPFFFTSLKKALCFSDNAGA